MHHGLLRDAVRPLADGCIHADDPETVTDYKEVAKAFGDRWNKLLETDLTGNAMGECYRNSAEFVLHKSDLDGNFEGSPLLLCHGDVKGPDGTYHGHAWVEWGDGIPLVFDPSTGHPTSLIIPAPSYYELGGIDPDQVMRYTQSWVMQKLVETEFYGPWRESYE